MAFIASYSASGPPVALHRRSRFMIFSSDWWRTSCRCVLQSLCRGVLLPPPLPLLHPIRGLPGSEAVTEHSGISLLAGGCFVISASYHHLPRRNRGRSARLCHACVG